MNGRVKLVHLLAWSLVVLCLAGCSNGDEGGSGSSNENKGGGSETTGAADPNSEGGKIFSQVCSVCHGKKGEGLALGPTLLNVREHWNREEMMKYLLNAPEYAKNDERLAKQKEDYRVMMPAYPDYNSSKRRALVDYVFALSEGSD